jgi:multidrug efflux pump subunit AcrA (membrane-fusion protein)
MRAAEPPTGRYFTGRTQAVSTVKVRPRVTGELTRVAVKEGAAVAKGNLSVEIDPRPYRIDSDVARARVKAAEAKLQRLRPPPPGARAW